MTSKNDKISGKIGLKIKLLRIKSGFSQEKLAEFADLSKNSIGAIERGESSPSIDTLDAIAKAFGMSLIDLVDISKLEL